MSRLICIDCHVLIWGIRGDATPGQEVMIQRAESFIENCTREKSTILIPSVVLAEFLVRVDVNDMPAVEEALTSRFQIGNFDVRAAKKFAELHQKYRTLRSPSITGGGQKMKKDFMIVATALAHGADLIISHDDELGRFAQGMIAVHQLPESSRQSEIDLKQGD